MTRQTLLPPNHTPFEEAFDLTGARIEELAVDIPKLVRPYQIPSTHLAWLAWGLSVDLWEKEWSQEKHRTLAARSLPMHARKGTQASIAEHIRIMGADPRRFIVPPAKTFMMEGFTEEERQAFLDRFPQLRVYPYVARGINRFAHFTTKAHGLNKAFLGTGCLRLVNSMGRFVRTATLWDKGVETDLTIRAWTSEGLGEFYAAEYDEVILPAKPSVAIFLGAFNAQRRVGGTYLADGLYVDQRMIRIPRGADYAFRLSRETYTTAKPGVDLIDVRPRKIAEPHFSRQGMLFNGGGRQFIGDRSGASRTHLPPSDAWKFLYEQWHIHDPDRVVEQRKRSIHLDHTRLGMPPYTAEITLAITGKAHPREAWRYVRDFLRTPNTEAIDRAAYATRVSKAARDKVLLQTKTFRPPRPGDRKKVGSLAIGQLIDV